MSLEGQTDGQTDTRSTQNYSSEPHNNNSNFDTLKAASYHPM